MSVIRGLIDTVAPPRCVACHVEADGDLCATCADGIAALRGPGCLRCGAPGPFETDDCAACLTLAGFDSARSLVVYAEPVRSLVLALKRRGPGELARVMGALMADAVVRWDLTADAVTYVPAPRWTEKGFDQAEILARGVGRRLGLRTRRFLVRTGHGPRQADVGLADRRSNVASRFVATGAAPRVLLIDDVYTTGATAEACSLALRGAGAERVHVITWARTLRRPASHARSRLGM